jgi:hypothetical protein
MRFRTISLVVLCTSLAASACERIKSANPLGPDVAGPIPGVQIISPVPLDPPQGGEVIFTGTPVTLTAQNATTNGERQVYLRFEVAGDVNFQRIVHQADRVEMGGNGRTSHRMPEPLGAGATYYWRVKGLDGANSSEYSFPSAFTVKEDVIIETPVPIEPLGAITTNKPNFRVRNGRISGTSGVYYRFEIATAPDPAAIAAVITVAPGATGETSVSLGDLPYARTLYWRVHGSDGTKQSAYSQVVSFTTPQPPQPPQPPPVIPPPTTPGPTPPTTPGPTPPTNPSPGGGGGGRTPDPAPGQRLPLPNMAHVVEQVAAMSSNLNRDSCGTWLFMDYLVDTLRTHDTRWGYNWKRGNVGDPSHDVVAYHWGRGPDEGSTEVYLIDVIGGHCSAGARPTWIDVTDATYSAGGVGRWTGRGRF